MHCRDINRILPEYSVGALDDADGARVREHLQTCDACRAELEALEKTAALLEPVAMVDPPRDLWPGIAQRLQPRESPMSWWRAHSRPVLALAAAAVLLIAIVFAGPMLQTPGAVAPVTDELQVLNGTDGVGYAETQLAAAWNQPFADEASLALAMVTLEPQDVTGDVIQ